MGFSGADFSCQLIAGSHKRLDHELLPRIANRAQLHSLNDCDNISRICFEKTDRWKKKPRHRPSGSGVSSVQLKLTLWTYRRRPRFRVD